MEIKLNYGSENIALSLPEEAIEEKHTEPVPVVDHERFKRDIHSYLYSLKHQVKDVGIVISDKTRLCQFPVYLPLITRALEEQGVASDGITFYIAYGTHPRQTEEECLASYGEIYNNYSFIHHDARDEDQLKYLGTTSRGTDVKINKAVLKHDLLITFGAILHHYFAGFGGGRKLLFPGLADYSSILQNHRLFLDFKKRELREGCQSGDLKENPLALDLEEVNAMLPPKLEIHGILNSKKEVCEIHFGLGYDQFMEACEQYDSYFRNTGDKLYDVVVASAGGYPKDINYIQAHKSIHNAASFVKDGGTLVIYAECRDGIGNKAFMELFGLGGWEGIFSEMEEKYVNNAGTSLSTLQKARRISIHFITSLEEEICRSMGMIKTSGEEARKIVRDAIGDVAWIGNASLLYK